MIRSFEEFDTDVLSRTLSSIIELFAAHPNRYLQAIDGACNIMYLAMSLLPEGEVNLSEIFEGWNGSYRSIYRCSSVEQITVWLETLRNGLCEILKSRKKTYKDHIVTNVKHYINDHIEERLTLNEVSDVFGISHNYLSVLFKKNCGIGFSEYITQTKVAGRKPMLLEENLKIYEVADRLGFETPCYFSKVFKKVGGRISAGISSGKDSGSRTRAVKQRSQDQPSIWMKQSYFHPYRGIPVCRSKVILSIKHRFPVLIRICIKTHLDLRLRILSSDSTGSSSGENQPLSTVSIFSANFPSTTSHRKTPCRLHRQRAAYMTPHI